MNRSRNYSRQGNEDFKIEEELKKKIKLNDESDEFLYARGPRYDENIWPIQCFLCRWTYITNERKFRSHIVSDRHILNLKKAETEPPNAEEYRQIYEQVYSDRNNLKNPIKIYPGEDICEITPEYADRLLPIKVYKWDNPPSEKVTEELKPDIIMDYNNECPILGLCYGFKMAKNNKVRYHCALCSINLNETNAYQHFVSLEHSLAYAKAHYPETYSMLSSELTSAQKIDVIRFYYHKIEEWKGLRPFYLVNANYFDTLKDRFLPRVSKIYHYNEYTVKFTDEEIKETAEAIMSGIQLVPTFLEKLPNQPEKEEDCLKIDTSSESIPKNDECDQEKNRKRRDRSSMKRPSDEKETERAKRLGLDNSAANWQKYRIYCDKALRNLNSEYSRFFDISERHPKYQEEWRRFYRMRTDQLRRDRINPNDYNFMPDWNRYWIRYLEDCYNADAEKCRFEIRKTLRLPFRCRTPPPSDNIIGNSSAASTSGSDNNSPNTKGPVPLMDLAISNPFSCDYQSGNSVSGETFGLFDRSGSRGNDGSDSNNLGNNSATAQQPQPLISDEQLQRLQQQQQPKNESSDTISVLSVLRLLAALEFELGSLGPVVNQLLGKAVLYEKESKMSANELLHENEYFTVFVTALEKMKGVVQAGVIEEGKIFAANKCIKDLKTILNLFEEYLRNNPNAPQKHLTKDMNDDTDLSKSNDGNNISDKNDLSDSGKRNLMINNENNDNYNDNNEPSMSFDSFNKKQSAINNKNRDQSQYGYDNMNDSGNDNLRDIDSISMGGHSLTSINKKENDLPKLMENNFHQGFGSKQQSGSVNW